VKQAFCLAGWFSGGAEIRRSYGTDTPQPAFSPFDEEFHLQFRKPTGSTYKAFYFNGEHLEPAMHLLFAFPESSLGWKRDTEMKNILNTLTTSAVLVAGICAMSLALNAADAPDAVSKLFADARTQSSQLSADWKSYTRQTSVNWTGDTAEVTHLKEDVDATAKTATALNDFKKQASPEQAATIDRIVPVIEEIADNTTKAMQFLGTNQKRLSGKEYKEYLQASSDTSNQLAGIISKLVDYLNHKSKFDEAKRTLELASNK
jgi:hypothetical protein